MPVCIDTGASCCISNDCSYFVCLGLIENVKVTGIASGFTGIRIVQWTFMNDNGQVFDFCLLRIVCMCMMYLCAYFVHSKLWNRHNQMVMVFMQWLRMNFLHLMAMKWLSHIIITCWFSQHVQVQSVSSLSTSNLHKTVNIQTIFCTTHANCCTCITSYNIWAFQNSTAANCIHLICPACQFGKVHCWSMPLITKNINTSDLRTGDCISCHQLESLIYQEWWQHGKGNLL